MDQILKGIAASDHPESVKKSLIQQLVSKAANEFPEDQCVSIFEMSSQWMIKGSSPLLTDSGKLILTSWGKHHRDVFQRYFTEDYLIRFLDNVEELTIGSVNYLRTSFDLLQHTPQIFSLYTIIRHRATIWINCKADIDFSGAVCRLLIDYNHCWPVGDNLLQMCIALVHCLSKTELPKSSKLELKNCIRNAGIIAALLNRIWTKNQTFIFPVLTELFKIISTPRPNPSVAVGSNVQFFSPEVIDTATNMVARSVSVSDENLSLSLARMISWLSWPGGKRVDQWIICFLRALALAGKHSILIKVTLEKLPQVFSRLLFPMVRESTMAVLSHMLLSFQHSPQAFHLIVEHVPDLVKTLKKEDSVSSQSCLQTLTELMHCLMYRYSGFPELYGPVLDCLQDFQKPSDAMIKKWLAQSAWTAQTIQLTLSRVTPKSETGRTGLVNLGNTCYMNSIIQALYMLDEFNSLLMTRPTTTVLQRVLYRLQETFVFLKYSQRTAFAPSKFLHIARPPWFFPGSQQDCSEFLKYLLDKLEEEDRAITNIAELKEKLPRNRLNHNIIEETFEGKLVVCHRCRRCNYVSCREEAFTDLPLAFPQNSVSVDREFSKTLGKSPSKQPVENTDCPTTERSLKGGDIGQRPPVGSISSTPQDENSSSSESEGSSSTATYPLPKGNSVQGKASNMGVGAEDPTISLEEMLGYFFEPEVLEGANQYHCEQCQSLQDAERSVVISKAPNFLVLTLKRFSYNADTHQRSKILQSVTYPLRLKLSNVRIKDEPKKHDVKREAEAGSSLLEERRTTTEERERIEAPPTKCTRQDNESTSQCAHHIPRFSGRASPSSQYAIDRFPSEILYALTSVVVHSGVSSESGHYYCYGRPSSQVVQQDDNTTSTLDRSKHNKTSSQHDPSHSWCLFNDSRVSYATYESFTDITKRFPKDTPYVLIYKNVSGLNTVVSDQDDMSEEGEIAQDLMDAVNHDNIMFLKEIEQETRMFSKPKVPPPSHRRRDDDDDDSSSGSGCGSGPGFSTPFNRFIF